MKIETEIRSKEHIKPSLPTPHHLRIHRLSLFDQIVPPLYVPLVLYFPASENPFISEATQILKRSLSETLTHFYPLAGRVRDHLSINCNDEGILFKVAKVKGITLTNFLKKPDPIATRAHIPSELKWEEPGPRSYVAMAQINYFECGGVALGLLFLHSVMDGATIGTFMKSWSANARGSSEEEIAVGRPDYTAQSFFPQNEELRRESHLASVMRQYFKFGKTAMRRYVFDSSAISKLGAGVMTSPPEEPSVPFRPSRVEIVSALIWKCFIAASVKNANKSDPLTISLVTHGVNMRRKAVPLFPDQSFGNFLWLVPASTANQTDTDLKHLVRNLRNAIDRVDSGFVGRVRGKDGFTGYLQNLEETWDGFPENADYLSFSSWCNFGLYGVDFGWGNPVWITKCDAGSDVDSPFLNQCWLTDTRQGGGIEVWVTLDKRYAAAFDAVQELRDFASVDPNPLDPIIFINGNS